MMHREFNWRTTRHDTNDELCLCFCQSFSFQCLQVIPYLMIMRWGCSCFVVCTFIRVAEKIKQNKTKKESSIKKIVAFGIIVFCVLHIFFDTTSSIIQKTGIYICISTSGRFLDCIDTYTKLMFFDVLFFFLLSFIFVLLVYRWNSRRRYY